MEIVDGKVIISLKDFRNLEDRANKATLDITSYYKSEIERLERKLLEKDTRCDFLLTYSFFQLYKWWRRNR